MASLCEAGEFSSLASFILDIMRNNKFVYVFLGKTGTRIIPTSILKELINYIKK